MSYMLCVCACVCVCVCVRVCVCACVCHVCTHIHVTHTHTHTLRICTINNRLLLGNGLCANEDVINELCICSITDVMFIW